MNNKKTIVLGWSAVISVVILAICSRSSFLYPFNDWNDANSFFTMGKAMSIGQVLYKDLFEQKGPYLYLIYLIGYLIKHTSFWGVYVLEILSMTITLYYLYKIMVMYCKDVIAICILPLACCSIAVSRSFYWGGSAEEFCLPFIVASLYDSMNYFKNGYPNIPDSKMILRNGIFAGVLAMIKYTLLGFHFAWMAMIAFAILGRKNIKKMFEKCLIFLIGMFLAMIPWIVYFSVNNAWKDFYDCYIYTNIFVYSDVSDKISIGTKIYNMVKILYWRIYTDYSFFVPIIVGYTVYICLPRVSKWYEKINLMMLIGFMFVGIYIGGADLPYYSLPISIFTVVGCVVVARIIDKMLAKESSRIILVVSSCVMLIACARFSYCQSMNVPRMNTSKNDLFICKFAQTLTGEDNPTLLNYGVLDVGLYTAADIMPSCRFYHQCNLPLNEMKSEQERYIREGLTDYVVASEIYPDFIFEKYDLIQEEYYDEPMLERTYYLFKRKDR